MITATRWLKPLVFTAVLAPVAYLLFGAFGLLGIFLIYVILDQSAQLSAVWKDILKRPYITWIMLHRLIYLIATLGVVWGTTGGE